MALPVPPMMPIVSPLFMWRSMFSRFKTSGLLLYEKSTLSKSMLPSAGVMSRASSLSVISMTSSKISPIRCIDARHITMLMKMIAIIISDIIICITKLRNADKSPTAILPAMMLFPPSQTIAIMQAYTKIFIKGKAVMIIFSALI